MSADGAVFTGATQPPGGAHAEVMALRAAAAAGALSIGSTVATTLEPCNHQGRTGPCTEALIAAGVRRVIVAIEDPDVHVAGTGIARLREAGIRVTLGVLADEVTNQLEAYLHHRRTGRPMVTLKLASTLDGRTAAPDGTSQWITSLEARRDTHQLRAEHDAILVGAGTVRTDNPTLTVRHVEGPDPKRVVLGRVPPNANVHPCIELQGPLDDVLRRLGDNGILSVLIEGGATVAHAFHAAHLVDRYVLYLAPALMGGNDGLAMFAGPGASTIAELWRGRIVSFDHVGPDLRVELRP